jgi:hypothetical protein
LFATLFALLLLRALVPSGFMPDGEGWVQLCSFDGPRWVLDSSEGPSTSHDRCFWDQGLSSTDVPAVFWVVAARPTAAGVSCGASSVLDTRCAKAQPPARGPPIS